MGGPGDEQQVRRPRQPSRKSSGAQSSRSKGHRHTEISTGSSYSVDESTTASSCAASSGAQSQASRRTAPDARRASSSSLSRQSQAVDPSEFLQSLVGASPTSGTPSQQPSASPAEYLQSLFVAPGNGEPSPSHVEDVGGAERKAGRLPTWRRQAGRATGSASSDAGGSEAAQARSDAPARTSKVAAKPAKAKRGSSSTSKRRSRSDQPAAPPPDSSEATEAAHTAKSVVAPVQQRELRGSAREAPSPGVFGRSFSIASESLALAPWDHPSHFEQALTQQQQQQPPLQQQQRHRQQQQQQHPSPLQQQQQLPSSASFPTQAQQSQRQGPQMVPLQQLQHRGSSDGSRLQGASAVRNKRWSPRTSPVPSGSPRASETSLPPCRSSPRTSNSSAPSFGRLSSALVAGASAESLGASGGELDLTFGGGSCVGTFSTAVESVAGEKEAPVESSRGQGLEVTFGCGGLAGSISKAFDTDSIAKAGSKISSGKVLQDCHFEVNHVICAICDDAEPKKLADCLVGPPLEVGSLGKPKASAAVGGPRKQALVRLPHSQEWLGQSRQPLLSSGRAYPEWESVVRQMQMQRILGTRRPPDVYSLMRWYLPYIAAVALYTMFILVPGSRCEVALLFMPLLLAVAAGHVLRIRWWEYQLLHAVDESAAEEVRKQLHAPLGWGSQWFEVNLNTALQGIRVAHQGLLLRRPPQHFPWRCGGCAAVLLAVLGLFRALRFVLADREGEEASVIWMVVEVVGAVKAMSILVFVGCSHTQARLRSVEVELRLHELEAAFNAMLDILRPLLESDSSASAAMDVVGTRSLNGGTQSATNGQFRIRLVTSERQTLRAMLSLGVQGKQPFSVACSTAGVTLTAEQAVNATPTDLRGGGRAGGRPEMPLQNSSAPGWAAALLTRFGNPRQDDAYAVSLSSASTAVTASSRNGNQVDDTTMYLVTGMVTMVCSRKSEPLEVLRCVDAGGLGLLPPKAFVEEPCLILAVAKGDVTLCRDIEVADPLGAMLSRALRGSASTDSIGLLSSGAQLRQLLEPEAGSKDDCADSPRSSGASNGTITLAEREGAFTFAAAADGDPCLKSAAIPDLEHIVMLFDSYSERDLCLSSMRGLGLLCHSVGLGQP